MLAFLTRRAAAAVVILLTLSLVIFVLQAVSPGIPPARTSGPTRHRRWWPPNASGSA